MRLAILKFLSIGMMLQFTQKIIGLLTIFFLLKGYSIADVAIYYSILSFSAILTTFISFGFPTYIINKSSQPKEFGNILSIERLIYLVSLLVGLALILFEPAFGFASVVGLSILLFGLNSRYAVLKATDRVFFFLLLNCLIQPLVALALIFNQASVLHALSISYMVAMIISIYSSKAKLANYFNLILRDRKILAGFMFTSLLGVAIQKIDISILTMLRSEAEVANYGVAASLAMLLTLPIILIDQIYEPIIARNPKDQTLFLRLREFELLGTFLVLIIIFLAFQLGSQFIPPEYLETKDIFYILTIGHIFNAITGSSGLFLIHSNAAGVLNSIVLKSIIYCLAPMLLLIYFYGPIGAAISYSMMIILIKHLSISELETRLSIRTWSLR